MSELSKFFSRVKVIHGKRLTQEHVDAYDALFLSCKKYGITNRYQISYMCATAYHETGRRMAPTRETIYRKSQEGRTDAQITRILAKHFRKRKKNRYWVKDRKTGKPYWGRGAVQITHKSNYRRLGKALGVDLVNHPEKALEYNVAYRILSLGMRDGMFCGGRYKLSLISTGTLAQYRKARRLVNGTDKARTIAMIAERYEKVFRGLDMQELVMNNKGKTTTQPKEKEKEIPMAEAVEVDVEDKETVGEKHPWDSSTIRSSVYGLVILALTAAAKVIGIPIPAMVLEYGGNYIGELIIGALLANQYIGSILGRMKATDVISVR